VQFLQGQFTNDVREVTAQHSQLSSFCSPKGRMLANFRIFQRDGTLYLQLPRENLAVVLKRLGMFILRAKVTLEDASDELVGIGLAGACAPGLLEPRFPEIPAKAGDVLHADELTLIRLPDPTPRFQLVGPDEAMRELWQYLSGTATPADQDHWALLELRAGIPSVHPQTVDAFVPQMVNMHLIDGVSFRKGCYTGQEIVARMQYLGKLKRRMYLAHVDTDQAPAPGDELSSPATASGQGAGKVVDARHAPEGGYDLLAVIEIESAERGELHLGDSAGPILELRELPYRLEVDEQAEG
jgi:folate-binding protein YgfZ